MVGQAIVAAESGAIVADRKELKVGFSTIGCGFAMARVYGQLRFVKNVFAESAGAHDFDGGR